ncbi:MAG: hypothetical protein CO167_07115 [Candidatus Marinimicrobia bacterium CG_4_9_14_3_um_filter_48_9]|nr:MAG: hypothetical protein CO167_07115 [Candidatus Marinimicrobia bacterium CG_4_9_14_3_um_filter_48_9]
MILKELLNRNIRLLWAGQLVSQSGDAITHMATIWLMLQLTGSATMTGLVAFAGTFPALIFGLIAGVVVDRFNRRNLMLISDMVRFSLVLTIPLLFMSENLSPLILAILVFLMATFSTLFNPARDAILPQLTSRNQLFRVNTLMQSTSYFAYFAGLFGAGIILGWAGLINLFYLDAITFAFSFIMIWWMVIPKIPANPSTLPEIGLKNRSWQDLKIGLRYVWRDDRRILGIVLITALNNFFIMGPAVVGIPLVIKSAWGGGGSDFAFVESTYGIGMLLGAILVYWYAQRFGKGVWLMLGMIYDGLTFIPILVVDKLGVAPLYAMIGIIFIHSIGIPFIQVTRTTLIHSLVPNHMQGRVFAMVNLAVIGMTSLSVALTGIIAEMISPQVIFLLIGIGGALCGVAGLLYSPIRQAD